MEVAGTLDFVVADGAALLEVELRDAAHRLGFVEDDELLHDADATDPATLAAATRLEG